MYLFKWHILFADKFTLNKLYMSVCYLQVNLVRFVEINKLIFILMLPQGSPETDNENQEHKEISGKLVSILGAL